MRRDSWIELLASYSRLAMRRTPAAAQIREGVASIVHDKDLSPLELEIINAALNREFNFQIPIAPAPDDANRDKSYFLLRNGNELAAFGRLHDIAVQFRGEQYPILGIATIVALKKRRGYGRSLMEKMKEYIESTGKTTFGFCRSSISEFYEKCGFSIIKGGDSRFVYTDNQNPASSPQGVDVLYLAGNDGLIAQMMRHPEEKIRAYRAAAW